MKNKTMWVLLGLLVACAAVIGLMKIGLFDEDMLASRRVFSDPPLDVTSVTLEKRDGETIQFTADGEKWRMVKPTSAPADKPLVDNLVRLLRKLEFQRAFDPKTENFDDGLTGLDKPLWTVTLKNAKGRAWTLDVGFETPAIGTDAPEVYVRPAGESKTFVVRGEMATTLGRSASDYRRRTLLDFNPETVEGMSISGKQALRLVKRGEVWRMTGPTHAPADLRRVNEFLGELQMLKAVRMLPGGLTDAIKADYGLDEPRMTLTLRLPGNLTQTLWVGNHIGENVMVAVDGGYGVGVLSARVLASLERSASTLRDSTLLTLTPEDVQDITITRVGKPKIILKKTEGQWAFTAPFVHAADDASVMGLLAGLNRLKADDWIDPKDKKLDISSPEASVTLRTKDGETTTLNIGGMYGQRQRFCQVAGSASIAAVNAETLSWVSGALFRLWPKTIIDLPKDDPITEIQINRQDGDHHLIKTPQGWMLTAPTPGKADVRIINTLTKALRQVNGIRILAIGKTVPAEYAKLSKSLVVTFSTPSDESVAADLVGPPAKRQIRLRVARRDEGTGLSVAWREDQTPKVIYQVSIDLMDVLDNPLAAPKE